MHRRGGGGGGAFGSRWKQLSVVLLMGVVGILTLLSYLHYHVATPVAVVNHAAHGKRSNVAPVSASHNTHRRPGWVSSEKAAEMDPPPVLPTIEGAWQDERPKHTGPHRVYCMVPFVWPHPDHEKHAAKKLQTGDVKHGAIGQVRYKEIMETWGSKCDMVEFFIDRPPGASPMPNLPTNVIEINMTRFLDKSFDPHDRAPPATSMYRYGKHIWEKVWRSWVWVRKNRAHQFDWFVKVDDDSFLFPENIRWFVDKKGWSPLDAHYFGHKLYHRDGHRGVTIIAGGAVIFSRATLELAATAYEQMPKYHQGRERQLCEDRPLASEEMTTARCLRDAGLYAEPAVDEHNREMIYLFFPSALYLEMKRPPPGHSGEGWYWRNKPENTPDLENCCSTHPIAFHNMKRHNHFRDLTSYFYDPSTSVNNMDVDFFRRKERSPGFQALLQEIKGNLTEARRKFSRVGPKKVETPPAAKTPPVKVDKCKAAPEVTRSTVRHDWIRSSDKNFVALGVYRVQIDGEMADAVLGDGKLPVTKWIEKGQRAVTSLKCQWKHAKPSQAIRPPQIEFMHDTNGSAQYTQYSSPAIPFSAQLRGGLQLHTQIVYCYQPTPKTPLQLVGLVQKSKSWSLDLSKAQLVDTTNRKTVPRAKTCPPRVTMCMNPIYNLKSSQWLIEMIEYHRVLGVDHIHIYRVDEDSGPISDAVKFYQGAGGVTVHDWSYRASGRLTASSNTYEHAKYLMLTDCALRSRGVSEFIVQNDVDELLYSPSGSGGLFGALTWMQQTIRANPTIVGFSLDSQTVTSVYRPVKPPSSGQLLLEQYDGVEPKCFKPYNCGKYHRGRQKYFLHVAGTTRPTPLWTHAISRDYTRSDALMLPVPPTKLYLRHYQGWWYIRRPEFQNGTLSEVYGPISSTLTNEISRRVHAAPELKTAYSLSPKIGLDWVKNYYKRSTLFPKATQIKTYTCGPHEAQTNLNRFRKRNSEWWSHSACSDSVWMDVLPQLIANAMATLDPVDRDPNVTVFDIGCNKGYASMDYLDALAPWTKLNPASLYNAMETTMKEEGFNVDKRCGVCNDCRKALADPPRVAEAARWTDGVKSVNVYCYEPAPSTFKMLQQIETRLTVAADKLGSAADRRGKATGRWILKNLGFTNVSGMLYWHPSCGTAIGSELCSIVAAGTPGAIKVPTMTVDDHVSELGSKMVHVLKIDAEGYDPLVLDGASGLLRANRAILVVFEWNPGLRSSKEKDGGAHGFWASKVDFGGDLRRLNSVIDKLDSFGYDCYIDSKVANNGPPVGPPLYRVTGQCMGVEDPDPRGWANCVCAARKFPSVATHLLSLSTALSPDRIDERRWLKD